MHFLLRNCPHNLVINTQYPPESITFSSFSSEENRPNSSPEKPRQKWWSKCSHFYSAP